jgi:galacturan 1,4-alpha-galacturonidase
MQVLGIYLALWMGLLSTSKAAVLRTDSNVCTVKANGHQKDDVPNILKAFQECGNGGKIVFPEDQSYWIATRLNPVVNDVVIEWHGKWTVGRWKNLAVFQD